MRKKGGGGNISTLASGGRKGARGRWDGTSGREGGREKSPKVGRGSDPAIRLKHLSGSNVPALCELTKHCKRRF